MLHLTRKVDLFHLRGQSDQPLVVGRPKKNKGIGFMKTPKGLEDNETSACKLQGLEVAKVIDGIYRQGKISGLHTNRDEVIVYHVTFIGTEIKQELSLAEALHANQFYQFRLSQGEIEDIFQVRRPAAEPPLVVGFV